MMVGLLEEIIPIGLFLALGPTRIISTILLLTSAHPMRNALALLAGSASVYIVIGSISLALLGRTLSNLIESTPISDITLIAAGVFLLIIAVRSLFSTPAPNALPSGWMRHITSVSPGEAFLYGIILACSVQYLLVFLSGITLIYETEISLVQNILALLVLLTLALLCQILPIALYAANPKWASVHLSAWMEWLNRYYHVIMPIFSSALAIVFLVVGVSGLIRAVGLVP